MNRGLTLTIVLLVTGMYTLMLTYCELQWGSGQLAGRQAKPLLLIHIAEEDVEGKLTQIQTDDDMHQVEPRDHQEMDHKNIEQPEQPKNIPEQLLEERKLREPGAVEHEPPAHIEAAKMEELQETDLEYYDVLDVTTAPQFPLELLVERLVYPLLARRQGREGVVLLELLISEEGKVVQVDILEDPGYGMGEAAQRAFTDITAVPAEIEGKQTAVRMRYPVRFFLD